MEDDKKGLSEAKRQADLHWGYVRETLATHGVPALDIQQAGYHYKTAFAHGWKHGQEAMNGKAKG